MSSKNTTEELASIVEALVDSGDFTQTGACREAGIPESTYRSWRDRKKPDEPPIEDTEEGLQDLCESGDTCVANLAKRLRTAQRTNTQLRRVANGEADITAHFNEMLKGVERAASRVSIPRKASPYKAKMGGTDRPKAIAEILFSDFQIGKIGQYYNTDLAKRAISKYGQTILEEMEFSGYNFEKIIFASLGDIVEDHLKHGVQSSTSTDSGLAEQMANAIEAMWLEVIQPLGELNIPMEVICIAGNHGSSNHKGMDMYKAGLYSYDYPIYKSIEGYCKALGWNHIKFTIPEGVFAYTEIYGRTAVYEHGYFNSCTEKSLTDQKAKRSQQIKRHVEYFRCGDMHHVCDYNNGQEVVNGAFFGVDHEGVEYSGILGFNSTPAQKMMIHTREDSIGRNTIKHNINIQVADGY